MTWLDKVIVWKGMGEMVSYRAPAANKMPNFPLVAMDIFSGFIISQACATMIKSMAALTDSSPATAAA